MIRLDNNINNETNYDKLSVIFTRSFPYLYENFGYVLDFAALCIWVIFVCLLIFMLFFSKMASLKTLINLRQSKQQILRSITMIMLLYIIRAIVFSEQPILFHIIRVFRHILCKPVNVYFFCNINVNRENNFHSLKYIISLVNLVTACICLDKNT